MRKSWERYLQDFCMGILKLLLLLYFLAWSLLFFIVRMNKNNYLALSHKHLISKLLCSVHWVRNIVNGAIQQDSRIRGPYIHCFNYPQMQPSMPGWFKHFGRSIMSSLRYCGAGKMIYISNRVWTPLLYALSGGKGSNAHLISRGSFVPRRVSLHPPTVAVGLRMAV